MRLKENDRLCVEDQDGNVIRIPVEGLNFQKLAFEMIWQGCKVWLYIAPEEEGQDKERDEEFYDGD